MCCRLLLQRSASNVPASSLRRKNWADTAHGAGGSPGPCSSRQPQPACCRQRLLPERNAGATAASLVIGALTRGTASLALES